MMKVMNEVVRYVIMMVTVVAFASTQSSRVMAQTCDQACNYLGCDYNAAYCYGGVCQCYVQWEFFYSNPPCTDCAFGTATYYGISGTFGCGEPCSGSSTVRQCLNCVIG